MNFKSTIIANLLHTLSTTDLDVIIKFLEKNKDTSISIIQPISDLLSLIIRKADPVTFDTIMKYDIDVDAFTVTGTTPLIIASYHGLPYFIEKLLQKGAKVSLCKKNGNSALSICLTPPLTDNKIRCARLLIKAGSDIEHFNNQKDNQIMSHVALLLKEIIALEKPPGVIRTIDFCGATTMHMPIYIIKESKEFNLCKVWGDNYVFIRAVKPDKDVKIQERIIYNHQFIEFTNNNCSTQKFIPSPKMIIELPVPGEKIIGHILSIGMIVNDEPITELMICRFDNIIFATNMMGIVESFCPSSIYY